MKYYCVRQHDITDCMAGLVLGVASNVVSVMIYMQNIG